MRGYPWRHHLRASSASAALFAVLAGTACEQSSYISHPLAVVHGYASAGGDRRANLDDELAALADSLSGFAGLFVGSDGQLVVRLTDVSRLGAFRARIGEFLARRLGGIGALEEHWRRQADAMQAQPAEYDYRRLHTWYHQLIRDVVPSLRHVTKTDIDERRNRIVIGVRYPELVREVEGAVARLGLPDNAVVVEQFDGVRMLYSLRDYTRPVLAGVQIQGSPGGCTLGYNVAHELDSTEYFVTAAHCTDSFG